MANNYLLFSCMLKLKSQAEADWCSAELTARAGQEDPETDGVRCNFEWSIEDEGTADRALWMHSEEYATPEHVALFVQAYLAKFAPESVFALQWAETCSNPRVDEFSGGACVVSATEMRWMPVSKWIADTTEAFIAKAKKATKKSRRTPEERSNP